MNKAIAALQIRNLERKNNGVQYTEVSADQEYLDLMKLTGELEETLKYMTVEDPAWQVLSRQLTECYTLAEAFAIHFKMEHKDHLNTFKVMASFPVKKWMKDEVFVEEVDVFVNKCHRTKNKDVIAKQIETNYRHMKYDQGMSATALRDLEIVVL